MGEVKRYVADRVPILWDDGYFGRVQEVVLATAYDALLADARRLRGYCVHTGECDVRSETGCTCGLSGLITATAYLEETP